MADPEEVLLEAADRMEGALQALKRELAGVRSGRAHPGLIENLSVDYYGTPTPLKQLGSIGTPEARMLTVSVWDRGAVSSIEKAIRTSDLGLNPNVEGQTIRLPIPTLTEQRRKDLVRLVNTKAEESRVAVRNVRRNAMDNLRKAEKEEGIGKDEIKRHEDELQKLTDAHIAQIDQEFKRKEAELLEI